MKRLDEEKELKIFCATRLDRAVNQLSTYFEQNESTQDGEALVALATVKQVRDFLCGSLKFKNSHTKHTIHPATIQVCFSSGVRFPVSRRLNAEFGTRAPLYLRMSDQLFVFQWLERQMSNDSKPIEEAEELTE